MLDEQIVSHLKSYGDTTPLVEALRLVADYGGGEMTQFRAIACLKQAFPHFPLNVLMEASTSIHIIGEGGLTDLEIARRFPLYSGQPRVLQSNTDHPAA